MTNTREKLIELLIECRGADPAYYGIEAQHIADHLIANGVGLREQDCHWATEQAYKNGKADAMKWIPVTERLPEKDIRVLVWMRDNKEGYTQMDTDRWSCTMEQGYHWVRWGKSVTHWMPLPDPPKGE